MTVKKVQKEVKGAPKSKEVVGSEDDQEIEWVAAPTDKVVSLWKKCMCSYVGWPFNNEC